MINFFIERPVFSAVIAIVIALAGVVALFLLPVASYPKIAPPVVRVGATFTGGSALTVAEAVATPLEQAINGVDGMIYIESTSSNDGQASVNVTFEVGYDTDIAAVDVLTRVNQARPTLPETVRDAGVTIAKTSPQITAVVSLFSPDGRFDALYLSNYATINLVQALDRIPGVGRTLNFTQRDYAIRIWLDPDRMRYLGITADAVIGAVRAQNVAVAAGTIGQEPVPPGQDFELQVNTLGRLETPEQFADIILRTEPDGTILRIDDVARVELGAQSYGSSASFSGQPSAQVAVFQAPAANALQLVGAVSAEMDRIKERFPEGLDYRIAFDTTRFVTASIREVVKTMLIAAVLVVAVTFLFLQKWRTTIIPVVVIPVALVGSFAVMFFLGFSINQLTLLGLILAVGLVVDDAIVVTENVERNMREKDLQPRAAAKQAMGEVAGPVIATTLVLFALFVPVAFTPGITGRLYNQFALTVAIAVGLSSVLSLSLTPAMCGVLLKKDSGRPNRVFRAFNSGFERIAGGYRALVVKLVRLRWLLIVLFLVILAVTVLLLFQRPRAFVPQEDQGYFVVNIELPAAAALERTEKVVRDVDEIVRGTQGVADTVAVAGRSFIGDINASYYGFVLPVLADWSERNLDEAAAQILVDELRGRLSRVPHARVQVFNAPPIPGIGSTSGVTLQLQDLADQGVEVMSAVLNRFIAAANERPETAAAFSTFSASVPQLYLDIDRGKAEQLGVDIGTLFTTLQTYLGSFFVNEFNRFGRTYRVYIQAEGWARNQPADIGRLSVANRLGEMVPLDTLLTVQYAPGPEAIPHYNLYPSAQVNAQPALGTSSGQLIAAMEQVAAEILPPDFGFEWTGVVYQQKQAGNFAIVIFALAVVLVFLVLAAQYESFAIPFIIILVVPLALFGALSFLAIRNLDLDVFGQIGLLMLVGLAAKNSILIVQFARDRSRAGAQPLEAAAEAARLRLRPILMTALSFILGATPLMVATGAGANARISLGTTVVGGMVVATILSLVFVPVAYVLLERLRRRRSSSSQAPRSAPASSEP